MSGQNDGHVVVLDGGTGIRPLGRRLQEQAGGNPLRVDLLLSHTHWDHIQGLPFFAPVFARGNSVRIWGAKQGDVALDMILRQQMHPVVFPVPLDELAATLSVEHVTVDEFALDGFTVGAARLRHPGNTLAFRLTPADGGPSMAYVTDNELGPGGDYGEPSSWRQDLERFLGGVDLLIHDAMFTPQELPRHHGWGHSSYADAVALACAVGARRLVLFHHSPERDDAGMDELVEQASEVAAAKGDLDVMAAVEGMELAL